MSTQEQEPPETEEEREDEPAPKVPETPHQDRRLEEKAARQREASEPGADLEEETVHLRVFRYDPEVEAKREPRFDDFHVPLEPGMSVLDALIYARDHFDSSLTFRHSCRQAVCGSDAFFVNGRQKLGCQTLVGELDQPVRI